MQKRNTIEEDIDDFGLPFYIEAFMWEQYCVI